MSDTTGTALLEPGEAKRLIDSGAARLVDVREADEHRRERIAGAVLAPLSALDPAALELPAGTTTILHCRSGKRAGEAAERLARAGRPVAQLRGGIDAWKGAGLPVVVDRTAPMPTMQQTQIIIGGVVLASVIAGVTLTAWALAVAGFMACGLIYAGASGNCMLNNLVGKLPWNRQSSPAACATAPKSA